MGISNAVNCLALRIRHQVLYRNVMRSCGLVMTGPAVMNLIFYGSMLSKLRMEAQMPYV